MVALAALAHVSTPVAPAAARELAPVADVWVYSRASDPVRDEAMRVWGSGGLAAAENGAAAEDFSYGYLRFELGSAADNAKVVGGTLTVTNVPNPAWSAAASKAMPLEARPLRGSFDEKSWIPTDVLKVFPDPKIVYGTAAGVFKGDDKPTPISIELKGDDFVRAARAGGAFFIALTSKVDAAEGGTATVYKVSTKESPDPTRRPRLTLRE